MAQGQPGSGFSATTTTTDAHSEYVLFSDAFYSPDSDFTEGTPQILENVNLKVDGKSKIFDNSRGGDPIHIAYEEAVELENSVSTSLNTAFTFDTTATSETTVSGSYAGASLEQKLALEVHAGFSKEEGKDTAESKEEDETVAIEFDCHPGGIKLLEVNKDHKRELIPDCRAVHPGFLDQDEDVSLVEEGTGHEVPTAQCWHV